MLILVIYNEEAEIIPLQELSLTRVGLKILRNLLLI